MKHSIILKSIAIVLAAVALVAAVGGAMGLIGLADAAGGVIFGIEIQDNFFAQEVGQVNCGFVLI